MIAYELTYILRPDSNEDSQKTALEKMKSIIQSDSGKVVAVEDWGRRRLAYPIKKETKGIYTHLVFTGKNETVAELERNLRINEQVLRFLTIKLCDDFDSKEFKRRPTQNILKEIIPQTQNQAQPS